MANPERLARAIEPSSETLRLERPGQSRVERWLLGYDPLPDPRLRLFCFPPAGGDANTFRDWQRMMPPHIEVIGIQYPGRGRNQEALISNCDTLVTTLLPLLSSYLALDFAFFGHSNGALISFEVARRLRPEEKQRMRHHFISAKAAPHLPRSGEKTSELSDTMFIQKLRDIGGTPPEMLRDEAFMRMLLPRLRADFRVGETYLFHPGPPLSCDMTLLRGSFDRAVDRPQILPWIEHTTGRSVEHTLAGDHFFINSCKEQVLEIVGSTLRPYVVRSNGQANAEERDRP